MSNSIKVSFVFIRVAKPPQLLVAPPRPLLCPLRPVGPFTPSLIVDAVLLGLFAIQHSVMARPGFKAWWTRIIPRPIERSTYVLLATLLLALLFWQWRPILTVVWDVQNAAGRLALQALRWIGWLTVLFSTFLINHFDLFGLRQVYLHQRGREY